MKKPAYGKRILSEVSVFHCVTVYFGNAYNQLIENLNLTSKPVFGLFGFLCSEMVSSMTKGIAFDKHYINNRLF